MPTTRVTQAMGIPLWTTPVIRPSGTHVPGTTEKEPIMTINLHDITGQESGIILVETDDGRHMNVIANWGDKNGLPYLFEPMLEPFSFVFLQSEDVHVETERIHSGTLNDEIAHDGLEDWNPLDDDLESDEPCDVYPLSNGWIVVAPKEWN